MGIDGVDGGGGVTWTSSPAGLSVVGYTASTFTFNPSNSTPTSYVVTAWAVVLTNCMDTATVNVYCVEVTPNATNVCWQTSNPVEIVLTNSYAPGGITWSGTNGLKVVSATDAKLVFTPTNSVATNYAVKAEATEFPNCFDTATVNVYRVELTPRTTNVWWQTSNPVEIVLTNSYAPGGIIWSGTNGLKVISATDAKLVFTPTNSVATNYAVKAVATGFPNCCDTATVNVYRVELEPAVRNVFWHMVDPVTICVTNSYAPGGLIWSGTNGLNVIGTYDDRLVFMSTNSTPTNYTVTAAVNGFPYCSAVCTVNVFKVNLRSIEFTTDHNLIHKNGTDITVVDVRYPDVEWQPIPTPPVNAPITHTASDTNTIGVKVTIECVGPTTDLAFNLHGTSSEAAFTFDTNDSFTGSRPKEVTITSSVAIGKEIRKFAGTINWSLTVGTTPTCSFLSGPHTVYTTLGTPDITAPSSASIPTPERMDVAVPAVATAIADTGESTNTPKVVWQVVKTQGTYYLGRNLMLPSQAQTWTLPSFASDPNPGADCISIAIFVRNLCMIVGVPGTFDAKTYMAKYATVADTNRPMTAVVGSLNATKIYPGALGAPLAGGLNATWFLALADIHCIGGPGAPGGIGCGPNGLNAFEAAVLYTSPGGVTWYFPGGTESHFTDVNKIVQIFQTMVWLDGTLKVRAVDYTYPPGGPTDDPF